MHTMASGSLCAGWLPLFLFLRPSVLPPFISHIFDFTPQHVTLFIPSLSIHGHHFGSVLSLFSCLFVSFFFFSLWPKYKYFWLQCFSFLFFLFISPSLPIPTHYISQYRFLFLLSSFLPSFALSFLLTFARPCSYCLNASILVHFPLIHHLTNPPPHLILPLTSCSRQVPSSLPNKLLSAYCPFVWIVDWCLLALFCWLLASFATIASYPSPSIGPQLHSNLITSAIKNQVAIIKRDQANHGPAK